MHKNLEKHPKALFQYTNQDNAPGGIIDEVHTSHGIMCSEEEVMKHRLETWTGFWKERVPDRP